MKYFKTYEGFKKDYMKKIDLKDFKKIKKGTKLMYMGGKVEVLDNNGYVLKLKGEDGRTFMVNKSQFDHGGMTMRESVNEAMTPAITFEFPDERRARQFDLDIENSAIGIGDQVGNKVTVTEVDTKWRSTVKKFLIKNKGKAIEESVVTEAANVPSNIEKFAKERGVLRDVKQLARWAEKAGLGIRGGTAIGKGYDTLVLDLTYQGVEIYFDTYTG